MLLKISLKVIKKSFLVNFQSDEFTTPIFITLRMWKWECNIFNYYNMTAKYTIM